MSDFAVAVIGEINLDLITKLEDLAFGDITSNMLIHSHVSARIGGVGGSFALAASKRFAKVSLLTAVGADIVGDLLDAMLAATPVHTLLSRDLKTSSRVVLILHDKMDTSESRRRLIVTPERSPSDNLDEDLIDQFSSTLSECHALFIPAYQFLKEPSRSACLKAMRFCRQNRIEVAVDLVPHDLYVKLSVSELKRIVADCTIVISELKTLNEFLGKSTPGTLELADAITAVPDLRQLLPDRWLLLRFGLGNLDQFLVISPSGESATGYTGFRQASDTAGLGDKLAAEELYRILSSGIHGWQGTRFELPNYPEEGTMTATRAPSGGRPE